MKLKAKILTLVLVLATLVSIIGIFAIPASAASNTPSKLFLTPNSNWKVDNARFAAYFFGNGEKWLSMTYNSTLGVYEVDVPAGYPSVIFCRMNPNASANNWNNKWNQTADLTIPTNGNNYYVYDDGAWDKGSGTWSTLTYYLAGTFNEWGNSNPFTLSGNALTTTINLTAGSYKFKIKNSRDLWWSKSSTTITDTASNLALTQNNDLADMTLKVTKCGSYTFTFSAGKLTITRADNDSLHTEGTAATCTAAAVCSVCEQPYGDLGAHKLGAYQKGSDATCSATGTKAHYQCSVCEKYFADEKATTVIDDIVISINENAHNYGEVEYVWNEVASCTATKTCSYNANHKITETVDNISVSYSDGICTEAGTITYTATFADTTNFAQQTKNVSKDAGIGHHYVSGVCDRCDDVEVVHEHNYEYIDYVWAEDGSSCTATKNCDCGEDTITATAVITSETTSATCEADEYTVYTATFDRQYGLVIQQKTITNAGTKLLHSYTGEIKSDGNGQSATHSFKCVNGCEQYGGATAHSWNGGVQTVAPTCEGKGQTTYTCTVLGCGATYTSEIDALEHNYTSEVTTAATCTTEGLRTYTCQNDSEHTYTEVIDATGHTFPTENVTYLNDKCEDCGVYAKYIFLVPNSNWKEANARFAAYFFGNGETWVNMTDSNSDGIYEVKVPAGYPSVIFCRMNPSNSTLANNWDNKWNQTADLTVPADCNAKYVIQEGDIWDTNDKQGGWNEFHYGGTATCENKAVCVVCGNEYGDKLAHVYDNACDTDCNVCGAIREVEDHSVVEWTDAGNGQHSGECSKCHNTITKDHSYDDVCDARCNDCGATREVEGHSISEWTDAGNGQHSGFCSRCEKTITENHVYENNCATKCTECKAEREVGDHEVGSWTNNNNGTHTGTCGECSTVVTVDHTFANYAPNGDASCTEDGTKTATCACGATDTITDEGSMLDHDYGEYVPDGNATCLADGSKTAKCNDCEATDTINDVGSMIGHNFVDGKCVSGCELSGLYLKADVWETASARLTAYFFCESGNVWTVLTDANCDGIYNVSIPDGAWTHVIFVRFDPAVEGNSFDAGVWNQTEDLTIPTNEEVMYTISGWNNASWEVYEETELVFSVTGEGDIFGDWAPAENHIDMVYNNETGLYEKEFTIVPGTTYKFKVVRNHTFDAAWPTEDYVLDTSAACARIIITFNPETREVGVVTSHTYTRETDSVKDNGNCQTYKTYWYGCEYCSSISTTEYYTGNTLGDHKMSEEWSIEGNNHYHACTVENCEHKEDEVAHTPAEDDDDCTTAIKCTVCGTVTTPAAENHTPAEDDGNCLTAIVCSVCGTVTTPAAEKHTPAEDDDNCMTAIVCTICGTVTTEGYKSHDPKDAYYRVDDGQLYLVNDDCSRCDYENKSAVDKKDVVKIYNEADLHVVLGAGYSVMLATDIELTKVIHLTTAGHDIIIDMNDHEIYNYTGATGTVVDVLWVQGDLTVTITGVGKMTSGKPGGANDDYTYAVLSATDGATVNILNGWFTSHGSGDVIYATRCGTVNIEGGEFEVKQKNKGLYYVLDIYEKEHERTDIDSPYVGELGKINVKGGFFVNFNPANHTNDGEHTNKVVEGYCSAETTTAGTWSVGVHGDSATDKDHYCDFGCGAVLEEHVDANKDHKCDNGCKVAIGDCKDDNLDHECDHGCNEYYGTHEDKNTDHVCDYGCSVAIGDCEDKDLDHDCDYGCDKDYGTHEDKNTDHVCDYGCSVEMGTCEDANKDHNCDYGCDKYYGEHVDSGKDHECDYGCSVAIGDCEDANKDHKCDYGCGKDYGTHEDENTDHVCDYGCSVEMGTCEDANKDHNCDYGCDKYYGEHVDSGKDHECDYGCSVAIGDHKDSADDDDHVCDYGCNAVLEECDKNISIPRVEPSCATGLTEGKKCSVCETITVKQEVIPATGEHIFNTQKCENCDTYASVVSKSGVYYGNLQDAVKAGGEVTLLQNISLNTTLTVSGTVVINTGDFKLASTAKYVFYIDTAGVEFTVNGTVVLAGYVNTLVRSGAQTGSQTVLTVADVDNVKAILNAKFDDFDDGDLIFTGDVDNVTIRVKEDYVTHLAQYGYITGTPVDGMTQIVSKSDYYIGANGDWWIGDIDTNVKAEGVTIERIDEVPGENKVTYTIVFSDGTDFTFEVINGIDGNDGNGIESIVAVPGYDGEVKGQWLTITYTDKTTNSDIFIPDGKDGASVEVDRTDITDNETSTVYTVYFTDGEKLTITVPKVKDGVGIESIVAVPAEKGNVKGQQLTITYSNGTTNSDIFIPNGKDGADGNSITSVVPSTDKDGNIVITINFSEADSVTVTIPKGTAGADGEDGKDGVDGEDGITPKLRINEETNEWEISYDEGATWTSLGIKATGSAGSDAIAPQLRINEETNYWEVSYDEGATWTSLGIKATGSNGANAVAPKLRINAETNEWEVSYDDGETWTSLGIKATGDKGETGADGNDNNKIVIICIGIAALCIIVTIVAVSTKKFRRPWWILC